MKKVLLPICVTLSLFCTSVIYSQTDDAAQKKIIRELYEEVKKNPILRGFDVEKEWSLAVSRHNDPKVQKEIFDAAKNRYASERLTKNYGVIPSGKRPFSYSYDESSKTGYVDLTPSPMNANCVNAGFENMNFTNWTGGTYTNGGAVNWNTFTPAWTNGIMTQGNNQLPQAVWPGFVNPYPNRHTIMTIPPTLNNPPNCIGWDSIAINPSTHLSDIEFVPSFANGVTARLGNANNNYNETERLVYTMAVTALNSQFTISYAVIVYDGGHPAGEQPFFKITTRDQAGNPIAGCGQYQVDASQVSTDPNFIAASYWNSWNNTWTDPVPGGFNSYYYKKWTTVGMDLSAYIGQTITVEFRTGDCIWGGHWGYAYVDASCQPAQAVVNMCTGSSTAVLVAPPGYNSYQWYGPNGMTVIPGATNDTLNIANATVGQVYTVVLTNVAGCTSSMQTTLINTVIQVQSTGSTPSCQGGFSGTASVVPIGSNNGYTYAWTNMSTNQPVGGNTSTITGLAPGSYSVVVSSPNCGAATATVTVGVSPAVYYTDVQNFCMNPAQIVAPTPGSNYVWYNPSGSLIGGATTATLSVNNPVNGSAYTAVFTTPSGCKDSVKITITQTVNQLMDTISFCGSVATLTVTPGATNIIWYDANLWPYAQVGTGNNFNVTNPTTSPWWPSYYGAYTNPITGCKDSVSVYLTNIPSSVYPSNIVNTCVGQSTGAVTLNMSSGSPPPWSVSVTGPTNYTNNNAGATVNLTNLPAGTYTVSFNNGQCVASTTFTINSMTVNVNATVAPSTICAGQTAVVSFTYGGGTPTSCGPATSGCGSTTVQTVGTGTLQNFSTSWPCVYGNWYSNEKYQILYTASDLLAAGVTAGKISSIAFNVASIPAGMNTTFKNYRIKMGCTTASSLDPTNMQWGSIPFITPVTQTVWGPQNYVVTAGWNTHNLTTVWEWDGVSNLIVEICYEWVAASNYTTNAIMNQTATSYASFLVYYSDGTIACPQTNGSASYMQRPNTRFSTCQSVALPTDYTYSWNPTTGVSGTPPTVNLTPTVTTNYVCTVTSNVGGCSIQIPLPVTVSTPAATATNTGPYCPTNTIQLNATGGGTYSWSGPGGFTSTLQNPTRPSATSAMSGVYTVTVTLNGCTTTATTTVTVNSTLATTATNTGPYCSGATIQLNATGGTTYSWSGPNGFTSTLQNPTIANSTTGMSGVYTVTATANGCSGTATTTVTVNATPTVTATNTGPYCAGATIALTGTGGGTYSWSGPSAFTSTSATPTIPVSTTANSGVYTVTVTASGCTSTATTSVTVNPLPVPTATNTGPYCAGATIALTATGGGTYSWTGPSAFTSASATPSIPSSTTANGGVYTVTVTANGCTATATTSVTVNPIPVVTATNTGPYCEGTTISLTGTGGGTYSWSGPSAFTSASATPTIPLSATANSGIYTVTVTASGCTSTATTSVTVNALPVPGASNTGPYCSGATIALTATGGGTYSWSGPSAFASTSATPTIASATTANSGVYTVTVTANGCTATTTTSVTVNATPTVTATNTGPYCEGTTVSLTGTGGGTYSWSGPSAFTSAGATPTIPLSTTANSGAYTVTVTASGCTATATTSVTVNPLPVPTASNTGPYCPGTPVQLNGTGGGTYAWTGPNGFTSSLQNPVAGLAGPLTTGVYTLTVTANNCTATATTTVSVGSSLVPGISSNSPVCVGDTLNLLCSNGVSWSWSGPNGFSSTVQNPSVNAVTLAAAGTYSATVTDASGCSGTATLTVVVNALPTVTVNSAAICSGQATATLTAGGASTYAWTTGTTPSTGASVTAAPGTTTQFTVTGTDANGCVSTAISTVTVNALPVITVSNTGPYCVNGTIQLNATGGTTYAWTGPNGFTNATSNPTIAPATTVEAGQYDVTVTDANGCVSTGNTTVVVNSSLIPNLSVNTPVCDGDTLNFSCTNGSVWNWTGPNGFSDNTQNPVINPATPAASGTYSISVTDANGCVGTGTIAVVVNALPVVTVNSTAICLGQATATLTANGASTYVWTTGTTPSIGASVTASPGATTQYAVTGTDANGCVSTAISTVTVNALPVITVSNTGPYCVNGTIQLNATGGTTYAWTGPNGFTNATSNPIITPATTVEAGQYDVTVTDANGCVSTGNTTVVVNTSLIPNLTVNTPVCDGDTLNFSCANGITWTWSGPNGFSDNTQNPVINPATPAASGTYSISVTDANGCVGTGTIAAVVNALPVVTVNSTAICLGQATATLTANGASTYAWTTGTTPSTGASVTASPGTTTQYTVTGSDANGCVSTAVSTVTVNALPVVTVNSTAICPGFSANLTAAGASTYTWTAGTTPSGGANVSVTPASTTQYTVTGTDANGCFSTAVSTVTVNSQLMINAGVDDTVCFGVNYTVTATGPAGTSYTWNPGNLNGASQSFVAGATTTYVVDGIDLNGCAGSDTVVITVPAPIVLNTAGFAASCNGVCDGQVVTLASPATGPFTQYTYSWSDGSTTPSVVTACAGGYTVTVTNDAGCSATDTTSVTEPSAIVVTASGVTAATCNLSCDGSATINASGGTAPYSYSWSSVGSGSNPTNLCAGSYTCTIMDANSCSVPVTLVITEPAAITVSVTPVNTICIGQTASLTAAGAGGNGGYVYTWTGGTTPANIASVTANPAVTSVYTVSVTDVNGCTPATTTISVIVNPPLNITASNDVTLCAGQSTTLSSSGSGGDGNYTYTWAPLPLPTTGSAVTVNPSATTTYTVTLTDGCGSPAVSDAVQVNVNPLPTLSISTDVQSGCAELCVTFTANSNPASSIVNWAFTNSLVASGTPSTVCFDQAGVYGATINVTDVNGCQNTFTNNSLVTVYPVPVPEFSFDPQPATDANPVITFADQSGGATIASWNWGFGDELDSGSSDQNPVFGYTAAGTYDVWLTVVSDNGCIDSINHTVVINPEFTIYVPNAFTPEGDGHNETFFAKGIGIDTENYEMWIYDRWGNMIWHTDDFYKGWDGRVTGKDEIVQQDVYVWKIKLKTFSGEKKSFVGHVTVIK